MMIVGLCGIWNITNNGQLSDDDDENNTLSQANSFKNSIKLQHILASIQRSVSFSN